MISASLISKIEEQIERTAHLTACVNPAQLQWKPPIAGAWTLSEVLGHLMDCLAGFCAVFAAAYPAQLAHFSNLRSLPVNQAIGADVARQRIIFYLFHIREGFALLTDTDLGRKLPTAFVPAGETLMTLLLGNLEHLTNHKYQLFMYLKLMGVEVSSRDLYQFR